MAIALSLLFGGDCGSAKVPVAEVIRKMGISEQKIYRRKKQYAGIAIAELRKMTQHDEAGRKQMQPDVGGLNFWYRQDDARLIHQLARATSALIIAR